MDLTFHLKVDSTEDGHSLRATGLIRHMRELLDVQSIVSSVGRTSTQLFLALSILFILLSPASADTKCENMTCCSEQQLAPPTLGLQSRSSSVKKSKRICCEEKVGVSCLCTLRSSQSVGPGDTSILFVLSFNVEAQEVKPTVLPEQFAEETRANIAWPHQENSLPSQDLVSFPAFPNPPPAFS